MYIYRSLRYMCIYTHMLHKYVYIYIYICTLNTICNLQYLCPIGWPIRRIPSSASKNETREITEAQRFDS